MAALCFHVLQVGLGGGFLLSVQDVHLVLLGYPSFRYSAGPVFW